MGTDQSERPEAARAGQRMVGARPRYSPSVLLRVRHWQLLIVTLLLVLVYVLRHTGGFLGSTVNVADEALIAVAMFLSMSAAGASRTTWIVHVTVAAVAIALGAIGVLTGTETLTVLADVLGGYMVAVSMVLVLQVTLRQRRVSGDTLFGAVVLYLAVGILFGIVYTAIATVQDGAFDPANVVVDGRTDLYYFSFVTITSLGYGDITPVSDGPQILSTLESILGVVLLAALVGRIVGLMVAQETSMRDREVQEPSHAQGTATRP